jgi:soluble lytic murein transglycosylase
VKKLIAAAALLAVAGGIVFALSSGAVKELLLPLRHEDVIRQESRQWRVEPALVASVIYNESRFRDQTSKANARGLMQITPATAREVERLSGGTNFVLEDLSDPDVNIAYGTFYIRHLLDAFGQNEIAALAAYNAGQGNVAGWGGSSLTLDDIRFPETRSYVEEVLDKEDEYREKYAQELGY